MILAVFIAVLCTSLVFILLMSIFSADTMTISYTNNALHLGQTPMMLFKKAIAANWVLLVIGGAILVILVMIGTHRIAGPLFRFEKALDNMARGDLSDAVHLRNTDEGKDLAERINTFNTLLSAKIKLISKHANAVNDLVHQLQANGTASLSPDEIESLCQAIARNNAGIRETAEFFTLADE